MSDHFEHSDHGAHCDLYSAHTKLAASAPEGLGVEVGGVHAVRGRVDAGQLSLVEVDEGRGFLLHHLVGFGLTERRHLPAAVGCRG